jgi:hypothetical protein
LQEPLTEVPAAATATRSKARTQRQKKKWLVLNLFKGN